MASPPGAVGATAGDSEPLLPVSDTSLLQRVVGGLQPTRTWRRWLSRGGHQSQHGPARCLEGSQTDGERDVESGVAAADSWQSAHQSAGDSSHVPLPTAAAAAAAAAAAGRHTAGSVPATPSSQGSTAGAAADRSEITAAPLETAEVVEVTSAAALPAAVASSSVEPAERCTFSGLTLGERVANLGHLLGLGSKTSGDGDASERGSGGAKASSGGLKRFLSSNSNDSSAARGLSRSSSGSQPMCLICLEPLTSEDFMSGEAISLDCQCRGELALRHKACAIKWSRVKGDAVCDICKSPVANLPTPTPRASTPSGSDAEITIEDYATHSGIPMGLDAMPGNADMLFDCIRVTWVFMIIGILFLEMQLSTALWCGIIAGIGYTLFVRAMYRQQMQAAAAEAARIATGGSTPPPPAPPAPMLHHVVG